MCVSGGGGGRAVPLSLCLAPGERGGIESYHVSMPGLAAACQAPVVACPAVELLCTAVPQLHPGTSCWARQGWLLLPAWDRSLTVPFLAATLPPQHPCLFGADMCVRTKGADYPSPPLVEAPPLSKHHYPVRPSFFAPSILRCKVCKWQRPTRHDISMYISPPNATPWAAACDKVEINGNFNKGVRKEYAEWASDSVDCLKIKDKEPIPCPDYDIYASWILKCYNNISDDAVRTAYQKAYFPNGLKLSMREDVDYFGENRAVNCSFGANAESDSDLDPGTVLVHPADLMKTVTVMDTNDSGNDSDSGSVSATFDTPDSSEQKKKKQEVEIVWAKADRGVWGLAHVFEEKLYLTSDLVDDHVVTKDFVAPKPAPKGGKNIF